IDARRGILTITNSKFNDLTLSNSAVIKIGYGLTRSSLIIIEAINVNRYEGNGSFIEYQLENAISSAHALDRGIFIDCIVNDAFEGGVISINRGITSSLGTVNISNCEFEHNTAGFGGSVQIIGTQANLYFVNDTFADGVAHNDLLYQGFDIFIGLEVLPMMIPNQNFISCTSSSQHKRVGMRIYQIDDSYDREIVLPDYKGIYYVSNTVGDDIRGTGRITRPFKTIQRAHQVLYSVDTNYRDISVFSGTYGQGQTESVTDIGSHQVHISKVSGTNPIIQVLNVINPGVIRRNPFYSVGNGSLHLENLDFVVQPSTETEAELIRLYNNGIVTLTGCNVRSSEPFVYTRSNYQSSSWIHGILTRGGTINIIYSNLNNEIFNQANVLESDGTLQVNIQYSTFNNLINNGGRGSAIYANIYIYADTDIITNFTITGSTFSNCESQNGGAIAFNLGSELLDRTGQYLKIIDCNFNNNRAKYGGSISFEGFQSQFLLNNTQFSQGGSEYMRGNDIWFEYNGIELTQLLLIKENFINSKSNSSTPYIGSEQNLNGQYDWLLQNDQTEQLNGVFNNNNKMKMNLKIGSVGYADTDNGQDDESCGTQDRPCQTMQYAFEQVTVTIGQP
ncbi:MAG: hypothetical protein EZS28_040544, partial [Streblomastix strix]